jgi:hypothetical protein
MVKTELVSEILVFNSTLSQLIARKDFIIFVCSESFKSYTISHFNAATLKLVNFKVAQ